MKNSYWWLGLIIVLALVLRVWQLDQVPPALFGDEIDVGYQAYSLLKTGRDLYGQWLPFYVHSLSEYRAPFLIYSTVPFVGIFGLNEWGVRLPAVVWGLISIMGVFWLTRYLLGVRVALVVALMLGITPWHIHYSRAAFEVTMLLSFIIWGTYFFIKQFDQPRNLIWAGAILGLTPYIYSTAVVFVPLWVLFLSWVYREKLLNRKFLQQGQRSFLLTVMVVILVAMPAGYSMVSGIARERFNTISIFQDDVLIDKLNLARKGAEYITVDGVKQQLNPRVEYLFYNKPLVFGQIFSQNYLQAISPFFLFGYGDPIFRHHLQEMGVMYSVQALLLVVGLVWVIRQAPKELKLMLLGWLLIAPIPSAMTQGGGNHATRLFLMLPPLVIICGIGLSQLWVWKKYWQKGLGLIVVALVVVQVGFYLHRYFWHYPVESWRWWQIGYKQAMAAVVQHQDHHQQVIINNSYEPGLIRYLFYSRYEPAEFHRIFTGDQPRPEVLPGLDGFKLGDKLVFGQINESGRKSGGIEGLIKPGVLYLISARDDAPNGLPGQDRYSVLKTVYDPTGRPIFYVVSGNK